MRLRVYQLADEAGIAFILPIAKWRGLGGKADMWGRSYETFTHSAAAGAMTRRIGVFVTAHVPITTPAFAAKSIATIDHVTHGRAGLNIVCGWNPDEFDIHGAKIDYARRYEHGLEWFNI
jgi:alkanesulfonate monooxygenase SsuD/methylene tetrahydromethanopterin reductase-like flavin-dependent oxidoreductase (luciferase family)